MKHLVIVGAGFAGVRLARQLKGLKNTKVTLVNPSADFRYTPALYRIASGFKDAAAWLPIEWMLIESNNFAFRQGKVERIDDINKILVLSDKSTISYDDVVFAIGNVTSYFSIPGLETYAYGVKTAEEISKLKQHIHANVINPQKASREYAIVGAGPTGVELAAVMGHHIIRMSKRHRTSSSHIKVHLIEAGPRILPQMSERAASYATKKLMSKGVIIHTNMMVKSESAHLLKTSLGSIPTDNVIWTAGTANSPLFKLHPHIFNFDKRGKVLVDKHLQVNSHMYVCGDNASTPYSGLALTAINHANFIASDIKRRTAGKKRKAQKDTLPAQVIPLGEKYAIFQYGKITLAGYWVSLVRKAADIVGYTDILGLTKAYTIWRGGESASSVCDICDK